MRKSFNGASLSRRVKNTSLVFREIIILIVVRVINFVCPRAGLSIRWATEKNNDNETTADRTRPACVYFFLFFFSVFFIVISIIVTRTGRKQTRPTELAALGINASEEDGTRRLFVLTKSAIKVTDNSILIRSSGYIILSIKKLCDRNPRLALSPIIIFRIYRSLIIIIIMIFFFLYRLKRNRTQTTFARLFLFTWRVIATRARIAFNSFRPRTLGMSKGERLLRHANDLMEFSFGPLNNNTSSAYRTNIRPFIWSVSASNKSGTTVGYEKKKKKPHYLISYSNNLRFRYIIT